MLYLICYSYILSITYRVGVVSYYASKIKVLCRAEYTLPALFQSQAIRCLILSGYDDDPNSWMHRAIDCWSSDHPEGYSSMYVHCTYLVPSGRV